MPAAVRDEAMEAAGGKNVWLVGGGNLASSWADEGLIDEIIVTVVPVFIGEGLPFFARAVKGELRHVNTKTHANGMVELTYACRNSLTNYTCFSHLKCSGDNGLRSQPPRH